MAEIQPPQSSPAEAAQPAWQAHAKRWGARGALAATTFLGGAAYGLLGTETNVDIGPHHATAQVTLANEIAADLGPLGTVTTKSPAELGVKLVLKEIPTDGTTLGANDIANYESFFTETGRTSTIQSVTEALQDKFLQSGSTALIGGVGLWWLLGPRRRSLVTETLGSRRTRLATATALSAFALTGSIAAPAPEPAYIEGNPVLEAAGLHDVRTSGKLLDTTIRKYAPGIMEHVRAIDAYYAAIWQNLDTAYTAKQTLEQMEPSRLASMVANGNAETVAWISDNHCNTGTAGVAARFANKTKPVFILDTGDTTMGGTEAEKLCIAVLPQSVGDIPIAVALGNHDSPDITASQAESLGYKVLNGKTTTIAGYTILGDKDVMRSPFGTGIYQWGKETTEQQNSRLATEACAQDRAVDIVAIHEPPEAMASLFVNCAKFIASGHLHQLQEPQVHRNSLGEHTYTMLNGSTGGAAPNKQTVSSKLGQDATIVQLLFDKATKDPIGYRVITLHPDKRVTVGDLTELPTARTIAATKPD